VRGEDGGQKVSLTSKVPTSTPRFILEKNLKSGGAAGLMDFGLIDSVRLEIFISVFFDFTLKF
jgi:hypothetical protein